MLQFYVRRSMPRACAAVLAAGTLGLMWAQPAPAPVRLSLRDAETQALENHPQVLAAQDAVSEANQHVIETRSAYYPAVSGDLTGSAGNQQGRIGAGFLSASRLFDRFAQGITVSQLVTDSGRTPNLVASSRLEAQSSNQTYQATRYDVLVAVNRAYFDALQAQALVQVAQETVRERQTLADQVSTLAKNKLRSDLDAGFADVNLDQAKLLLIRSQDRLQSAFAELTRTMGSEQAMTYNLVEEAMPPTLPADPQSLVADAVKNRPELESLRLSQQAAQRFEQAERELSYPTVTLAGVGGFIPLINQELAPRVIPNEYAGAAVNVEIPIFNGHLFKARREAARYRTLQADQKLRDMQERITRDVRTAWASALTAYQRLDVAARLLKEASLALDLAQERYNLGLGSIVELTQAQLSQTQAEIENLSAKYDYQSHYAIVQYSIGQLR